MKCHVLRSAQNRTAASMIGSLFPSCVNDDAHKGIQDAIPEDFMKPPIFSAIAVSQGSQLHCPCDVRSHGGIFMAHNLSCSLVWRMCAGTQSHRAGNADVVEGRSCRDLRVQHFVNSVIRAQVPYRESKGEQISWMHSRRRWEYPQEQIGTGNELPSLPSTPSMSCRQ